MYSEVADRIHSLYFLATPHRGADSSSFVTTYLSMYLNSGQKAFVKELVPGNGTLQASTSGRIRGAIEILLAWGFLLLTLAGNATR